MTSFIKIGIGIATASLLSGCIFWGGSFHDDRLGAFAFREYDNPGLLEDINGQEDTVEGRIALVLPSFASPSDLVPFFRTSAVRVTCDGKAITSGETKLDFQTPKTFHVEAPDGTSRDWLVTVTVKTPHLDALMARPANLSANPVTLSLVGDLPASLSIRIPHTWVTESILIAGSFWWSATPHRLRLGEQERRMTINEPSSFYDVEFSPLTAALSVPHTLALVAGDGSEVSTSVTLELADLDFSEFQVLKADNPGLKFDLAITVDPVKNVIAAKVPSFAKGVGLRTRFTHTGLKVWKGSSEVISGSTLVDLAATAELIIEGVEGSSVSWEVEVTEVPASSSKSLTSIAFYRSSGSAVPEKPTSSSLIAGKDLDGSESGIDWDPLYATAFSKKGLYVEIATTGERVEAQGKTLAQGSLWDSPAIYDPANWLDFTNPVEVTIVAEDGSTKVLTITMRNP